MTNIVIVAHVISRTTDDLEEMIVRIGPALQLTSQCWTVMSNQAPNAILRAIIPLLGGHGKAFVVDCATNRAAWHNMGPEFESHLRQQWGQGQKEETPESKPVNPGNQPNRQKFDPRSVRQRFGFTPQR